jgi:hypothetical protein
LKRTGKLNQIRGYFSNFIFEKYSEKVEYKNKNIRELKNIGHRLEKYLFYMQIKLFGEKHLSKKLVDEQTYIVNIKLKNLLKGMKYSNIYKNYILSMLNFDKKLKRVSVKRKNNRELRRWFSKFAR